MNSKIICNFCLPGHEFHGAGKSAGEHSRTVVMVMQRVSCVDVDGFSSRQQRDVCSGSDVK